ncbi:MAG TPA: MlaD family protein [Candidatus Cloacimonas sp.]|nr:MlaD family protein [Candidatus Cloacimonas sp.]
MKKFYPNLRSVQIKTGIWTLIICIILVLGYLWLTSRLAVSSQYELQIAFPDVMGLEIGDKVMYRGMEVGRIKSIAASQDRVIVTVSIKSEIRLKEGTKFQVADSSLMGGKALNIIPGTGMAPLNRKLLQKGVSPEGMMALMSKASAGLDDLKATLQIINSPQGIMQSSQKLLQNADNTVTEIGSAAIEAKQELVITLNKIEGLTSSLQEVVTENKEPLKNTIAGSNSALDNLSGTLDSLRILANNLNRSAKTLTESESTAGLLLNDKQLYEKINAATDNLNALLKDIQENPQKYIKFSVF